jgi:quercetin 2,3-dioxygenase
VIGQGGVQWMTAGSGVLHKEYHDREFSKTGGLFQMVQLWVNLPAKDKMTTPKYQGIENAQLGKYYLPDNKGVIEVIAGEYKGIKGAASTFTPINMYNIRVKKGAIIDLSLDEKHNTGIVIIEGSVRVNDTETAPVDNFILFKNEGTEIKIEALEDAVLLVLSGEPINEPIMQYGPFLMNNKAEIMQAYDDLAKGKFGVLED